MSGWKWQSFTCTSLGIIQLLNPWEIAGELARADLPVSTEVGDLAACWKYILLIAQGTGVLRFVLNLICILNKMVNLEMFFLVSYQDFPSLESSE